MSITRRIFPDGTGNTPATDPHFNNVSLLLHLDGTNGSATYVDSSPRPKTITRQGSTTRSVLSTAEKKFGTSSLYLNGNTGTGETAVLLADTGSIQVAHHTDFAYGSGDYTVEFWFKAHGNATRNSLMICSGSTTGNGYSQEIGNWCPPLSQGTYGGTTMFYAGSSGVNYTGINQNVNDGNWHHVAQVRQNNVLKGYLDGVYDIVNGPLNVSGNINWTASGAPMWIGRNRNNATHNIARVYMDDIRFTKGVARYTGDFTIPAAAFPNSA